MSDLDITDAVLAELRSAADIVEVVGEHTRLKKAGRSWKGLCPFHNERTPSFTVDRDKGLYHCFGCGAGGDVIHFVRQIDRLDFPEAIESLASRFGVSIPRRARGPRDDRREKLYEAVAAAQRFYAERLRRSGNPCAEYLRGRGVPEELWRRLGLGYAPEGWETLGKALLPAFPESLLIEAGLLQPRPESRGAYDRFRDRLLFVLRDDRGRPVGFGGRGLSPEAEPKYLNSPESPIFLKKRTLYGLSEAREAMRRRDRVVLVEGYFDHLALLRAGVEETVASMGTALTPEQAEKLRRLCPHAILCYDGDSAGRSATRVATGHLLAQGIRASVARMPEGEDPDDVLGRQGTSALAARIEEAPDFLTWLLEDVRPNDPELPAAERRERIRSVLQVLDAITDRILRYEEYRRVAREVSVPVEVLWQGSEKRSGAAAPASPAGEPGPGTPGNPLVLSEGEIPAAERRILQALMGGGHKPLILGTLKDEYLTHPGVRRLVTAVRDAGSASEAIDFQRHFADFRDARDISLLSRVALEEGPEPTEEGVVRLLNDLERRHWERQKVAVDTALSRARNEGQPAEERELLRRAQEIGRRIAELKSSRKGRDVGH